MIPERDDTRSSDAELMRRLGQGDPEPLGDLYLRYGNTISSVVGHAAPWLSRADLEDLCQEVFMTVYEIAPKYREEGKLKAWLCGIGIRKMRNLTRRRGRRGSLLRRVFGGDPQRHAESTLHERAATFDAVNKTVQNLSPNLRQVLVMSVVDHMDSSEIAESLGLEVNAVWTRLHRARRAVLEALGDEP